MPSIPAESEADVALATNSNTSDVNTTNTTNQSQGGGNGSDTVSNRTTQRESRTNYFIDDRNIDFEGGTPEIGVVLAQHFEK